jgi:quercetin dioxygenase-like cupin family protein
LVIATSFAVVFAGIGTIGAQQAGFKRVPLQKNDVSGVAGRESVLARGEFDPGASVGKHTHPGDEVAYVLEGEVMFQVEGKPPATLKAGESLFVPAGTVHAAKNASKAPAKVLSTYIVEKGKPLATPVK